MNCCNFLFIIIIFILLYYYLYEDEHYCNISSCNSGWYLSTTGTSFNANGTKCFPCPINEGAKEYDKLCNITSCNDSYDLINKVCVPRSSGNSSSSSGSTGSSSSGSASSVSTSTEQNNYLKYDSFSLGINKNPNDKYEIYISGDITNTAWTYSKVPNTDYEYYIKNNKYNIGIDSGATSTNFLETSNTGAWQMWVLFKKDNNVYLFNRKVGQFLYFDGKKFYLNNTIQNYDNKFSTPSNLEYSVESEDRCIKYNGNKYLSTTFGANTDGSRAIVWNDYMNFLSLWTIKQNTTDYYIIINDYTGYALDRGKNPAYINKSDLTNINMKWKIYNNDDKNDDYNCVFMYDNVYLHNKLYTSNNLNPISDFTFNIGKTNAGIIQNFSENNFITYNNNSKLQYLFVKYSTKLVAHWYYKTQYNNVENSYLSIADAPNVYSSFTFEYVDKENTTSYGYYYIKTSYKGYYIDTGDENSVNDTFLWSQKVTLNDNYNQFFNLFWVKQDVYRIYSVKKRKYLCIKDNKIDYVDVNDMTTNIIKDFNIRGITKYINYNKNQIFICYKINEQYFAISLVNDKLKLTNIINDINITSYWYLSNSKNNYICIKNSAYYNGYLDADLISYISNDIYKASNIRCSNDYNDGNNNYVNWQIQYSNKRYFLGNIQHGRFLCCDQNGNFFMASDKYINEQSLNNNNNYFCEIFIFCDSSTINSNCKYGNIDSSWYINK